MKKLVASATTLALAALAPVALAAPANASTPALSYAAHVQNIGWMDAVSSGSTAGTTGRSLRLEALKITTPGIKVSAHVQTLGWMSTSASPTTVGTTGRGLRLEALKASSTLAGWSVQCQAHVATIGWMNPVSDGQTCGTTGQGKAVEAIRLTLVPTGTSTSPSRNAKLRDNIAASLNSSTVSNAQVSMIVKDRATGEVVYDRNSTTKLTPASNEKMLTTAAALAKLGPNYTIPTKLYSSARSGSTINGNLYLKGYGDPTLNVNDLDAMAASLRSSGVTRVTGGIVTDSTYFESARYNPGWLPDCYASVDCGQVTALTLTPTSDETSAVEVHYQASSAGHAPTITMIPAQASSYVKVLNQATTTTGSSDTIAFDRQSTTNNTIVVTGKTPVGESGRDWVAVDHPDLYAGTVFRTVLQAHGITVAGGVTAGSVPGGATLLNTHQSQTLGAIVHRLMKVSNNVQAEHLLKILGATTGQPGGWTNGASVVKATLAPAGIAASDLQMTDGSGEAYDDKVSAATIEKLEIWATHQSWFSTWYDSFPVGGITDPPVGGTLKTRFIGTPAAGNVRAKTGTLGDLSVKVTSLSGYVTDASGHDYIFATLANYTGATPRPTIDKMIVAIASYKG